MRQLKNYKAEYADAGREADDLTTKYAGKTQDELMRELLKNVARAKGNGTFSSEQLREFVAFISPGLDEASRARLDELAALIEGESAE